MEPLSKQRKARLAARLRAKGVPEAEVIATAYKRETKRQWRNWLPTSPFVPKSYR